MAERPYLGIDHVVLRTTAAEPLFELLHQQLGLPVTWPLQHRPFATYGWIGVGNTNLEVWAAADNADLPADCPLPLFHQIALAPVRLEQTVASIQASGLSCKAPRAFVSRNENGDAHTNFTNSVVLDLSSDSCCVFVCEWGDMAPIAPWKHGLSVNQRRVDQQAALEAVSGGRLGLERLSGIELTTPDVPAATEKWQRLSRSFCVPIRIADDVDLSVALGTRDAIQALTFTVRNLDLARRALAEDGLLEPPGNLEEVMVSLRATGGVRICLVEEPRTPAE